MPSKNKIPYEGFYHKILLSLTTAVFQINCVLNLLLFSFILAGFRQYYDRSVVKDTYQSTNYIGVDCADAVMAAYSRWKNKPLQKNYNVTAVVHDFPVLHKLRFSDGIPTKKVYWNRDIKEGDFIAVKSYGNLYFHIGALYKDSNKNGFLDGDDIVLHAGPVPLHYSSLKNGGFDGTVAIVRP